MRRCPEPPGWQMVESHPVFRSLMAFSTTAVAAVIGFQEGGGAGRSVMNA